MSSDVHAAGHSQGKLRRAMNEQRLVRVERSPKYANRLDGFVVDAGKKWSLLAQISDGGFFDGFVAFRLRDVGRVPNDKSFESAYARTRPEWPPVAPRPRGFRRHGRGHLDARRCGPAHGDPERARTPGDVDRELL